VLKLAENENLNEKRSDEKKRKIKKSHIKFILELIFMAVIGFLVLYPFLLFFINFLI
jgi:hypothetical protein